MELTGAAKEAFEKWYIIYNRSQRKDYGQFADVQIKGKFDRCIPSMKWGVYVDWFDSVGMSVNVHGVVMYSFKVIWGLSNGKRFNPFIAFNTRHEARTEAIKKASELFNNQER